MRSRRSTGEVWAACVLAAATATAAAWPEALSAAAPTVTAATGLESAQDKVLDKLDDLFTYGRNICIGLAAFSFLAFGVMLISGKFNPKWMWTSLAGVAVFGVAGYVANEFVTSSAPADTTLGGGIKLRN